MLFSKNKIKIIPKIIFFFENKNYSENKSKKSSEKKYIFIQKKFSF